MIRVALLVTPGIWPATDADARGDNVEAQLALIGPACAAQGIVLEPVYWTDPDIDWMGFDAVTPLCAWNYPRDPYTLQTCLAEAEAAGVRVVNPRSVVAWNMDKAYLAQLAALGAPVPRTIEITAVTPSIIASAFETLGCDEIIVKPSIGAGAWRQVRLKRGDDLPDPDQLPPDAALIQPFLTAVETEGEWSLLFFGGAFSHALIKRPKPGDYRTQGMHGAREAAADAPDGFIETALEVLKHIPGPLAYARVDLVRGPDGTPLLMELEVIEPYLYLPFDGSEGTKGATMFANVLAAAIA